VFRSTVHRVVFPPGGSGGEDRYSMAYFGHPVGTTVLEPVPSERVRAAGREGAREGGAMTANEHLMSRLKATYLGLYKDGEKDGTA
jgi:isopenicillin N synthase-like dioxygenase